MATPFEFDDTEDLGQMMARMIAVASQMSPWEQDAYLTGQGENDFRPLASRDMSQALRFGVGDRIECNVSHVWAVGTVTQERYREPDWPEGQWAAYQVKLDDGEMIFAPRDDSGTCRAAPTVNNIPPGPAAVTQYDLVGGGLCACGCGAPSDAHTRNALWNDKDGQSIFTGLAQDGDGQIFKLDNANGDLMDSGHMVSEMEGMSEMVQYDGSDIASIGAKLIDPVLVHITPLEPPDSELAQFDAQQPMYFGQAWDDLSVETKTSDGLTIRLGRMHWARRKFEATTKSRSPSLAPPVTANPFVSDSG